MNRFVFVAMVLICSISFAGSKGSGSKSSSSTVKGYTSKSGKYVAPYKRTTPDKSSSNNYSTKGNYNPHTKKYGTVKPK